jgi:hypothetical protein
LNGCASPNIEAITDAATAVCPRRRKAMASSDLACPQCGYFPIEAKGEPSIRRPEFSYSQAAG